MAELGRINSDKQLKSTRFVLLTSGGQDSDREQFAHPNVLHRTCGHLGEDVSYFSISMATSALSGKRLKLTVFLIKDTYQAAEDFVSLANLNEVSVASGSSKGTLYVRTR